MSASLHPRDDAQTEVEEGVSRDSPRIVQNAWALGIWEHNKGMFFVMLAESVASGMDAIARFLQQGGHGFHVFQVIFARMATTFILSSIYMWWTQVPGFPLGHPSIRGWLILRASFGFCGLFCLYYSVHYLPLAETTIIRLLVPIATVIACSVFLGQAFTKKEFIAGLVALCGVVIIAHPASIFGRVDSHIGSNKASDVDKVTSSQRLLAIIVSFLGIFCASGAYTTIRFISDKAHALMSVNYFAILGTVGSAVALLVIPGISFIMPQGPREWILLTVLGVLGFVLQFLLTAGLQIDKSSKATSAMYTQVLFALSFDWAIWGVLPSMYSFFGGTIIIASTLWVALQETHPTAKDKKESSVVDEESLLLPAQTED